MKVSNDHLAALRSAVAPLDTDENRDRYRRRDIPRADAVQDIDKRYRWDLLYASRALTGDLCAAYNDSHIDTALRAIVPALGD
jgi:hypothetical protein